jgi:methylenetetrahydrofolate dehydrogenase (NADP+)/methenyltetrahydrofolate cyclohydrolase
MAAHIIDGDAVAAKMTADLQKDVETLKGLGAPVRLAAVIATENRGARIYARNQAKSCEKIGIEYTLAEFPPASSEAELIAGVEKLNADPSINGIIIQMPLPEGVDARTLQMMVHPLKDVEGITPANEGRVVHAPQPFLRKPNSGEKDYDTWLETSLGWPLPAPAPCTPCGAMMLIRSLGVDLYGKEAVVVGHSEIVGKPMGLLLVAHFCTTTWCHIATPDLAAHTRKADLLCVAVGKAGLVTGDMIKPGAIVIDIGINRVKQIGPDGKPVLNKKGKPKRITCGDVDFDTAKEVAGYITPVPGGVGPMTVAMLLRNTVEAAKAQAHQR